MNVRVERLLMAQVMLGWLGVGSGVGCGSPQPKEAVASGGGTLAELAERPVRFVTAGPPLAPPLAADSLGLHATLVALVDSVPGDPDYRVRLPQVQLPDAGAARRINAVLVQQLAEVADTVPPVAARQAVRLARPMLRNHSGGNASGSLLYEVRYNALGLLSLEFTVSQPGASIEDVHHLTFDLRTGRLLRPADLVAQSQALARSLAKRCAKRKAEQLQAIAEELPDDPDMRAQLEGMVSLMEEVSLADFDFYLTRHGLVFLIT